MSQQQIIGKSEPTASFVKDLEDLLGREMLQEQYGVLAEDLRGFMFEAATMEPLALAKAAHRNAGASGLLGLGQIGKAMRSCQQAAAAEDRDAALQALTSVPEHITALDRFLADYF